MMRFLSRLFARLIHKPTASFRPGVEQLEEQLALTQLVTGGLGELYFLSGSHVYRYTDDHVLHDTHSPLARSNTSGLSVGWSGAYLLGADNQVWRYNGTSWKATTSSTVGPQNVKSLLAGRYQAFALDGANQLWVYDLPPVSSASTAGRWTRTWANGHDMSLGTDVGYKDEVWLLDWNDYGSGNYGVWRYDQGIVSFTGGAVTQLYAGHAEAFAFTHDGSLWQVPDQSGVGQLAWRKTGLSDGRASGHEFSLARTGDYARVSQVHRFKVSQ